MALTNHFSIPYMLTSKGSVEDNSLTVQHSLSRNLSNSLSGRMSFGRGFVSRTLAKTVQAVSEVSESTLVEKGSCLDVGDAKNQSNRSALAVGKCPCGLPALLAVIPKQSMEETFGSHTVPILHSRSWPGARDCKGKSLCDFYKHTYSSKPSCKSYHRGAPYIFYVLLG